MPFFLIALVPQVPLLVAVVTPDGIALLLYLLGFILSVLVLGATVYAVIQQQLGRSISIGESYRRSRQRIVPEIITGILFALALFASAILILFIGIGIPLFIYLLVIWYFFVPPIILEGKGPLAALERSRELVRGSWWRVFGIGVVFVLIEFGLLVVGSIAASILASLIPAMGDILNTGVVALLFPINAVGATLVYLDLRTRKEGYTLEEMASEIGR